MVNEAQPAGHTATPAGTPDPGGPAPEPPSPERLGQLVPAVVGALAILIVLAVRGTANAPSPLAIFAGVAVFVAVAVALVAMVPKAIVDIAGATRVSAWQVAVRTAYLALVAAALFVVQEIVVARFGNEAAVQADSLLALELLALLLIALFVARPRGWAMPDIRGSKAGKGVGATGDGAGATGDGAGQTPKDDSSLGNALGVLFGLGIALVVLAIALIIFAMQPGKTGLGAIGTGLAVGGGALGVGALLGLLFGIPRSLQSEQNNQSPAPETSNRRYRANTNLEEISDWLTKIIVGVSLTQLSEIQAQVGVLIDGVADGFGGTPEARAFVAGMLTMAVVAGFLAGYLLARLYLPKALFEADPEITRIATEAATAAATQNATAAVDRKVEEVANAAQDQIRADTEANRLVTLQLDAGAGAPEPPFADLAAAIKAASQPLRDIALQRASEQRSKYWMGKNAGDLLKMERTIPVFRALLETDPTHKHVIHGQLGFALKDRTEPDYQGAIEHLSEAISERDANRETGWLFYEFNRALARIRSEVGTPEEILADLCTAAKIDFIRGIIETDKVTVGWLTAQGIEPTRIREHCAGGGSGGGTGGAGGTAGAITEPEQELPAETGKGEGPVTESEEEPPPETAARGTADVEAAVERVARSAARTKRESAEAQAAAAATVDEAAAAKTAVKRATADAKPPKTTTDRPTTDGPTTDGPTTDGPTTGTAEGGTPDPETPDPDKPLDEADV